jgi:hypothetical protein
MCDSNTLERKFAVSVHDVAPATWPDCARLLARLDQLGISPLTLLVVPHYHGGVSALEDPAFRAAINERGGRGDEIALHGCYRRVLTAAEGEFAALTIAAAAARLATGNALLEACGWRVTGFVPPAWLLSEGARAALRRSRFTWTSSRDALIALPSGRQISAPSLVYSTRARWRRAASLAWNSARAAAVRDLPLVRLALHPSDAGFPDVIRHWSQLASRLRRERRTVLESQCVSPTATAFVAG